MGQANIKRARRVAREEIGKEVEARKAAIRDGITEWLLNLVKMPFQHRARIALYILTAGRIRLLK